MQPASGPGPRILHPRILLGPMRDLAPVSHTPFEPLDHDLTLVRFMPSSD